MTLNIVECLTQLIHRIEIIQFTIQLRHERFIQILTRNSHIRN